MTDGTTGSDRHLNFGNLDHLWACEAPIVLQCPGQPWTRIELEPGNHQMRLVTPFHGEEPDTTRFRHVTTTRYAEDGDDVIEVAVDATDSTHAAYGLLVSIVDQIQLFGKSLSAAVAEALHRHGALFSARRGLSQDQEIGLLGEILLLEYLIEKLGPQAALASWLGPAGEEHDFALPGQTHLECKTTTSERRIHMVTGLTQLVKPLDGQLLLLSTQLTPAGAGRGRTLVNVVEEIRRSAGAQLSTLDARLAGLDYHETADLITTKWTLRSAPRCYRVDATFPALTPTRLAAAVPQHTLIRDVRYRIDVTDLPPTAPPDTLADYFGQEHP